MTKAKRKTVKVNLAKWSRGALAGKYNVGNGRHLLNLQGGMCCLGFVCARLGVPRENLLDINTPYELLNDAVQNFERQLIGDPGEFWDKAMILNDNKKLCDATRQKRLVNLFKPYLDIVFVDSSTSTKAKKAPGPAR